MAEMTPRQRMLAAYTGSPADVRREVLEILEAFGDSRRLIVGTGDQVGGETADENIHAMIETARKHGKRENA